MIAAFILEEDSLSETMKPIRVTVWGENVHDRTSEEVRNLYPQGMHAAIADGLREHLGRPGCRADGDAGAGKRMACRSQFSTKRMC